MYKVREFPHLHPLSFDDEKYYESLEDVKQGLKNKFKDRHANNKYVVLNTQNMIVAIIDRKTYLFNR